MWQSDGLLILLVKRCIMPVGLFGAILAYAFNLIRRDENKDNDRVLLCVCVRRFLVMPVRNCR